MFYLYTLIVLGIEFYLFVPHGGMNDRGSTCKFRNAQSAFRNLHVDPLSFMRNKQVKFNPYIYSLSKLPCFGYEISVFKYTTGRYSEQPPEQPVTTNNDPVENRPRGHTSRMFLHGKWISKFFLCSS